MAVAPHSRWFGLPWRLGSIAVVVLLVGACASTASPSPTPSAGSSPSPTAIQSADPSAGASLDPTAEPPAPSTRVTAFYYAWYGTPANDGAWRHWNQMKHDPPDDLASTFYPERGPYSSRDPSVLAAQMADLRAARIGVIAVSWWGRGSWDDDTLDALFAAAEAGGIRIAFHLEPYDGQTAASAVADMRYLVARYGSSPALYRVSRPTSGDASTAPRPVFYMFAPSRMVSADLRAAISSLRGTADDAVVMIHSPRAVSATRVGADGVYTYDALASPAAFASLVADCRAANVICAPSVAPGFDNSHAVATGLRFVDRAAGTRYDSMWQAAVSAGAEWVGVTSFNEWHEGTQIEPAVGRVAAGRTYAGYDGAWGVAAADAPRAYLVRTAYWVERLG